MVAAAGSAAREYRAIGLIGVVHFASHFYQLALPPLIPFMAPDLNLSYASLGVIITVFYVATAALQTPVGLLVDRIGGRGILIAGLLLTGAVLAAAGTTSSYWMLVGYFLLAGIGNSVFHPADFSLLASTVAETRLGRAFSVHAIGGNGGTACAPVTMVLLATLWDWRTALIVIGIVGMVLAVVVMLFGASLSQGPAANGRKGGKDADGPGWRFLLSRPMLVFLLFYILTSAANSGMVNFSIVAMGEIYGAPLTVLTSALTVFLAAGMVGVVPGGFLADWAKRHDLILLLTYVILAGCIFVVGLGILPVWMVFCVLAVGGTMRGLVGPARDILVRRAAPDGTVGTAFAFVTTGWMVGNSVTPVFYGWLMDIGAAEAVFMVSAGFTLIAAASVLFSKERTL